MFHTAMRDPTDKILRDWVLHRLPEIQADALEQRLMLDDAIAAQLQDAQHDLIDDYARGRLDAVDRGAVEKYLLCTRADLHRLHLAQGLAREGARRDVEIATGADATRTATSGQPSRAQPNASRPRRRKHAVAGGAIAAAILLASVFSWRSVHDGAFAPPDVAAPGAIGVTANVTLLANTERGTGDATVLTIPGAASTVRLQVEVERPQAGALYVVSVLDAGQPAYAARNLALHQAEPYAFVEVVVPAYLMVGETRRISLARQGSAQIAAHWAIRLKRSN